MVFALSIDAVIFDLDGTLVDSALQVGTILNGMREERGCLPLSLNCFRKWISLGASELVSYAMVVALEEVPPLLQEFRKRYGAIATPRESLFPGAMETVTALAESRTRLGICSNKPERLCWKILEDTGLTASFGAVVGGDTISCPKPNRHPIDHALNLLDTSPESAIFVGDSSVDQKAAAAAGLPFVFFSGGYDDGVDVASAWACIDALPQLIAMAKGENSPLPVSL